MMTTMAVGDSIPFAILDAALDLFLSKTLYGLSVDLTTPACAQTLLSESVLRRYPFANSN